MRVGAWSVMLLSVAALTLAVGCGGGDDPAASGSEAATAASAERVDVVTSFYPLEEAARAIGGDRAEVSNLTPPGVGPHDLELSPAALADLERADVVLYVGNGFQSAVEKATDTIAQGARVRRDLLDGLPLRARDPRVRGVRGEVDGAALSDGRDPHVWVDPRLFARMARGVEAALIEADPAGRAVYEQNADTYVDGLEALDREFESTLTTCRSTTLVTSHAAFGYLADRYGLKQAPIAGISPDDEPDPKSLAATAALARADGVTTVFFETLVPRKLAETVAREIGARTDALDPVEGLTSEAQAAGATYTSVQSDNLDRLARGLECTRA